MRYLIPMFFLVMSILIMSSARAVSQMEHQDQVALQTTPAPISTSTSETAVPGRTGPPLSLTLTLLGMCCVFAIFIAVVVLGFVARKPKNEEQSNSK